MFLVITYGFISALQVYDIPWILSNNSDYNSIGGTGQVMLFPVMEWCECVSGYAVRFGTRHSGRRGADGDHLNEGYQNGDDGGGHGAEGEAADADDYIFEVKVQEHHAGHQLGASITM